MKQFLTVMAFFFCSTDIVAQNYTAADAGSEVKFSIKNFGLNVDGSFKGLQGKIVFDPANLSTATINVSVDAATVNTGNGSRDKHLKKDDYFDVAHHTKLTFLSSKISSTEACFNSSNSLYRSNVISG